MTAKLIDGNKALDAKLVDAKALSVLTEDRLRILRALGNESKYPAEVAKELKMQVQTAYYHFRLLNNAGLIELDEYAAKGGALAKKFKCTTDALAVVLRDKWRPLALKKKKPPDFLEPFISDGVLDAKMIIGAPEAHGKYRARGSEYSAVELAMYLGSLASFEHPLYYLDTRVKEEVLKNNLILVGGPKVNIVMEKVNAHLPIRFEDKTFDIYSTLSHKRYGEEVGILEVAENPFNKKKKMLVIAGLNQWATRVAVLALLEHEKTIAAGNHFDSGAIAKVVQGFDEKGDGIVDTVEFLE
ncbi:MAG: S-layer protein [Candidatus Micrarchaeota archaeon]